MKNYIAGLGGDDTEVTHFPQRKRQVYTAKWWWRPICRLLRRPTRYVR